MERFKNLKEDPRFTDLFKKIRTIDFSNNMFDINYNGFNKYYSHNAIEEFNNFVNVCRYLENNCDFKEIDYFLMKELISEVIDNFSINNLSSTDDQFNINYYTPYYGATLTALNDEQSGAWSWLYNERYKPNKNEQFKTVTQFIGHTNTKRTPLKVSDYIYDIDLTRAFIQKTTTSSISHVTILTPDKKILL